MGDQTLRVGRARRLCASLIGVAALAAPVALAAPAHATPVANISGHITVAQPILDQTVNFGGLTGFGVAACQGETPPDVILDPFASPCPTTSAAGQGANASGDFSFTVGHPLSTDDRPWYVRPYWNSIAVGPAIDLGTVTGDISGVDFSVGLGDVSTFTGTVTPPPSAPGGQPDFMGVAACPNGYGEPGIFYCSRGFARVSLQGGGTYTLYVPPGPSYRLVALMGGVSVGTVQGPFAPPANADFTVTNADLGTVSGTVTMSDSSPLPFQFSIRACLVVGGLPPCLIARSVNLQPGGAYSIRLPAPAGSTTTWDLAPTALGGQSNLSAPVQRTVAPGSSAANADFVIDVAAFGAVTGQVTLTGGSPPGGLSAVRVAACPAGFPAQFYAFCQPFDFPDAGGTYHLGFLPTGSYTMVAVVAGQVVQSAPASVVAPGTATGPNFTVDLSGYALLSADVDVGGQSVVSSGVAACPWPETASTAGCTNNQPITVLDATGGHVSMLLAPGSWNVVGFAQTSPGTFVGTPTVRVDLVAGASLACTFTVSASPSSACGPGEVVQVVTDGGVVTTDPGGGGATPDVPVQTELVVPSGISGEFSVTPQPAGPSPSGFVLFGTEMALTAPGPATVAAPYVATFTIDASALGGVAPADVQVFRDGALVADCTVAGQAVPDPCVAQRSSGAGGDAVITVRTTQFSTWSFGRLSYTFAGFFSPVDNVPTLNSVKAGSAVPVKFGLGGDRGLDIFAAGYPKSQVIACSSTASVDGIESTVNPGGSALTYDTSSGRYSYVWKTDKTWAAGSCRQLVLRFRDGSEARANFKFK